MRKISLAVALVTLAACGQGAPPTLVPTPALTPTGTASGGSITVYSGRSEQLVGPLVEQFRSATGITVRVRYADTAELAILLIEEGANSPADVFFAQDAGALGAVAQENMLAELPAGLLGTVPEAFRSRAGRWVGVSGRARVIAYDSAELGEADLPQSIDELTGEEWRGRIGWAPTNGSFQSFVTALRQLRGEDGARAWLSAMLANDPVRYEGNAPIVQAIADGEIDLGLVNHYYALRQRAEQGDEFPVGNHFLPANDPGALVNVAGVGLLATSRNEAAALRFIEYLLAAHAQRYFAVQTLEYPLVAGVDQPAGTPALADIGHPDIDLTDLADLEGSLALLNEVGVLP